MIRYRIKNTLTLACLVLLVCAPNLTGQTTPFKEKVNAQRVAFFTEKLNLSPEEAQKFWPVYNDYSNRKDKLSAETRNLRQYLARNSGNLTEKEVDESLQKYLDLKEDEHTLFVEYNSRFLNILDPGKVLNLYLAEDQFKQFLLRQLRNRETLPRQNRR